LSKIDEELLQKYSKVFFLNENYIPQRVSKIDEDFVFPEGKKIEFLSNAMPFLKNLLNKAEDDGLNLKVTSGYRSFDTQSGLKASYRVIYGAGTANQFSADQGYSEHQLGTAVDFTTPSSDASLVGFEQTPEYKWLQENAYRYGFILSYPPNNSYYIFEPWHWRFVGEELASKLHREKKNFFDLDQRDLDKYLVRIFDN
jgi:D-alanyl-D-alanine carboxypeptidase